MCLTTNSRQDPTGTAGARRQAFAEIRKRKTAALKEIRQYLECIPRTVMEIPDGPVINRRVYVYELNNRDVYADTKAIVQKWFETSGDTPPTRWFLDAQLREVVTRATAQEAARINQLSAVAGFSEPYQIERVLLQPEFRERIRRVTQRTFNEMAGFTGDAANDLARTLANGMAQGRGIQSISKEISERFDVNESRAQTIARTELGVAHRETRGDMTKDARDRLELDAREQWISALAPTTRPSHAERHLQIYTPEEVAEFYSMDGNSCNCLCVQQTVLIAEDGTVVGARKT